MPSLCRASRIASDKLGWPLEYAVQKILPMLTFWILTHSTNANEEPEVVAQR